MKTLILCLLSTVFGYFVGTSTYHYFMWKNLVEKADMIVLAAEMDITNMLIKSASTLPEGSAERCALVNEIESLSNRVEACYRSANCRESLVSLLGSPLAIDKYIHNRGFHFDDCVRLP